MLCVLIHVQLFVTTWTVACQISLSMRFHRQEYWLPLPPPITRYSDLDNSHSDTQPSKPEQSNLFRNT